MLCPLSASFFASSTTLMTIPLSCGRKVSVKNAILIWKRGSVAGFKPFAGRLGKIQISAQDNSHKMKHKELQRLFFSAGTWLGTPFFYLPIIAFLFTVQKELAVRLAIALLVIEVGGGIIKLAYPKQRPVPLPKGTLRQKWDAGSFPSIHTARITLVSLSIIRLYGSPASAVLGLLAALIVGYSRIYLKKHYLIDVVAGFAMGIIINLLLLPI